MFSKENRRFTATLIAVVVIGVAGMIVSSNMAHRGDAAQIPTIIGWGTTIILGLFSLIRQEKANTEAARHRHKIEAKVDDTAAKADEAKKEAADTKEVVVQIEKQTNGHLKEALETPAPAQVAMPKTPDELQAMVRMIINECDDAIDAKLRKAFEEQRKRDGV